MTSAEIRQSFLEFFKSKGHSIVPSSSLMPDSPGLLFTNAGMNQFVPIFLNQRAPDVDKWPGAIPGKPTRAADTQKCIRAGGKHNDLEDVGLDTYHHTFFEMLGNWSFGDYFKKEAIEWAWELVVGVWKFPADRLYATVYSPDKSKGDPSEFDQEAYDFWAVKFSAADLDPKIHIVHGGKKDNFWMMGETGPCGPCSEIHIDLTPAGDTQGSLVNKGDARCIEIWNLVFIQFNANSDGTFSALPARHVDTGMGFERVTGIMQNTRKFTDFARVVSNYETDIFRPLFDKLEKLSGKKYGSTLPGSAVSPQIQTDIAFRVVADHIRTLGFSIADGILPGNTDRNYVLRRILRRAVRYGRTLGFREPFFYKLADVLAETMGDVFPEVRAKKGHVQEVIRVEEEAFNKTLDRGIELFNDEARRNGVKSISGEFAFKLYDTYGFPLDLTELMAREQGLTVDTAGFEKLMEEQRARARAAQKKEIVAASNIDASKPTRFVGFDQLQAGATVQDVVKLKDKLAVTTDVSPLYAEMGGQVGDTGEAQAGGAVWHIANTQKTGNTFLHILAGDDAPEAGAKIELHVNAPRRAAIQRHHSVTHLLHWALHEVVSPDAVQKGSYVGPDKLTFDFSSAALTPAQVSDVEKLVNERIVENGPVFWTEVPYAQVKGRKEIMQFFGEKYGEAVRVVQIGGKAGELDGYSMELCGGTHARATGEVGLFRIVSESAVAAGIRRIEAVAGLRAYDKTRQDAALLSSVSERLNAPVSELERKIESLLAQQKELEKQLQANRQKEAAEIARGLVSRTQPRGATPWLVENLGAVDGDFLQAVTDAIKSQFKGVVVLGGTANNAVSLVAAVSPEYTAAFQAGKIIQAIAPVVGGKGGGKPDNARGGGREISKLDEALQKARAMLGG
ncbi:MAG TPA: alanine--tRNA ligase [Candidatus Baltobacteraceae bacterium]|jgi:alanyl-tRNA synthetase|nr:alanine--tRNA ligase [Candidatus Baltobacteraceae bacterium]